MNAGRAAERVHFQARIVGEEKAGCVRCVVARFQDGVLFEGIAVLDAGGNPPKSGMVSMEMGLCSWNSRSFPGLPVAQKSLIKCAPPSSESR